MQATTLSLFEPGQGRDRARRGGALAVDDGIAQYLDYLEAVGRKSPATVRAYRSDLTRFRRFLGNAGGCALRDVEPALVERWMASMRSLSTATVSRALNALSALYRWAIKFGHATVNPVDRVDRPRTRGHIQPCPTWEEVAALLAACEGVTQEAALLGLATSGLRRAELLGLTWEDVDLARGRLRIRGKGGTEREALIFEELAQRMPMLRAEAGPSAQGAVFRGRQGAPLQESTLQRWFNSWSEAAGLRDHDRNRYTIHSLRRFAAKHWLDSGLNIRHVQILLGHRDLSTTIRYLNYDLDEIQRAADAVEFALAKTAAMPGGAAADSVRGQVT